MTVGSSQKGSEILTLRCEKMTYASALMLKSFILFSKEITESLANLLEPQKPFKKSSIAGYRTLFERASITQNL